LECCEAISPDFNSKYCNGNARQIQDRARNSRYVFHRKVTGRGMASTGRYLPYFVELNHDSHDPAGRKRRETFMRDRSFLGALLLVGALVPLTSCTVSNKLTSIVVSPATLSATAGVTWQFTAIGYYTRPDHATRTKDITSEVTWASSSAQMVTVSNTGFASVTGISYGNTVISASAQGFKGIIVGTASVTVPPPTTSNNAVTSVSIQKTVLPDGSVKFSATGKTAEGAPVELTGKLKWTSSDSDVASIDAATGTATSLGPGRTTITVLYTNPDGTNAVGTAHWSVAAQN
jgi:Bacterial Ig-like domain (group 2)